MKKLTFFLVCIFLVNRVMPQLNPATTIFLITHNPENKSYIGNIILANGDTLKNKIIKLNYSKKNKKGVLLTGHNANFISTEKIKEVQMANLSDSCRLEESGFKYTKIFTLKNTKGEERMWRMLFTGKANIYDDLLIPLNSSNQLGETFLIMKKSIPLNTQYSFIATGLSLSKKERFVNYINKTYQTNFKKSDFKNKEAALKYIAENG
ncbi:MAG: hypothetical protein KGO81_03270 [Bacteroidota bacterium]|nr:hypothetical protein [Bacteroidota bacterium]